MHKENLLVQHFVQLFAKRTEVWVSSWSEAEHWEPENKENNTQKL